MINFLALKIRNFKSIKEAELTYDQGVWLVTGVNNDAVFDSNGAGKTTTMEAIQQCLFNKTTSPTPIEDTSRKTEGANRHTMKYSLECTFMAGDDHYRVVNDRTAMTIQIFKNSKDMMFKSIPQSLKFIQHVLGMDFNTFVTLTFINHTTITELLDNFSSSALMKVILNFSQIAAFEKSAKMEQKVLNSNMQGLQSQITTIEDSLKALDIYVETDLTPLIQQKVRLTSTQTTIKETLGVASIEAAKRFGDSVDNVNEIKDSLAEIYRLISSSYCEACKRPMDLSEDELKELEDARDDLVQQLEAAESEVRVCEEAKKASALRYAEELSNNETLITDIEQKIIAARTRNELYTQTQGRVEALQADLLELKRRQESIQLELNVIQAALDALKAGDIQKTLLSTFVVVLNNHLIKFLEFVSLDYIMITAEANKANVAFKIQDSRFSQAISIHTLSGGEKTRLRLVVLLAMLYTIQDLAQVSTNLLFFDESLDTLDSSAQEDLSRLFDYLTSKSGKFIAMVSHGGQLNAINFVGNIIATKTNGITSVNKELL